MKIAAVEAWVEVPLRRYVDDARARLALLLHPSGQVLAQAGFTREVDVMTACALAAASHATSGELGRPSTRRPSSPDVACDAAASAHDVGRAGPPGRGAAVPGPPLRGSRQAAVH